MSVNSVINLEANPKIQEFGPGDSVKVNYRVREGERERIQAFQGVVIKRRGEGPGANFTVRRVTQNIGVERTFPFYSPRIESVEVVRRGRCGEPSCIICGAASDELLESRSAGATRPGNGEDARKEHP